MSLWLNNPSVALKFLTVGHTKNQDNSMHAWIESNAQRTQKEDPIYEPSQWVRIIKCAKIIAKLRQCMKYNNMNYIIWKNYQLTYVIIIISMKIVIKCCRIQSVFEIEKDNPTIMKYQRI